MAITWKTWITDKMKCGELWERDEKKRRKKRENIEPHKLATCGFSF